MPVLQVWKAGTVMFIKRSLASGLAGIDNPLFYRGNTMMQLWGGPSGHCDDCRIPACAGMSGAVPRLLRRLRRQRHREPHPHALRSIVDLGGRLNLAR
jgi:NAD(P) transhydrogenase beta subunit